MLILVSGATKTVRSITHKNLGVLITPQDGNLLPHDKMWAADNAAYSNWDEKKFLNMLWKIEKHHNKPIFVACPDVVGNAKETAKRFNYYQPLLKELNLPVALVLQNGQEAIGVPWNLLDAIFIGGDDTFKLYNPYIHYIVDKAKSLNKWVHFGRVNSYKRMKYVKKIGADSIDGTGFSMFPDLKIPSALRFLEKEQYSLF